MRLAIHLIAVVVLLFVLPCLAPAQPEIVAPGGEVPPPQIAKPRIPQQPVKVVFEDLDLRAGNWAQGSLETLKRLTAADIVKMQIFALKRADQLPFGVEVALGVVEVALGAEEEQLHDAVRMWRLMLNQKSLLSHHFGTEGTGEIAALLALIAKATTPVPVRTAAPLPPDRVLVVQPVKGEPFEFLYNASLHEPFAGVYSRELKEALYALSEPDIRMSLIELKGTQIHRTLNLSTIPAHRGGIGGQDYFVSLCLAPEQGLLLRLKLKVDDAVIEGELPAHFGQAVSYPAPAPWQCLVLLHEP